MLKTLGISITAMLLLAGCAGEVERVQLANGKTVKNVHYMISDDPENYLSEIYLHYTKANIFTLSADLQTSHDSNLLHVNINRHHSQNRKIVIFPFSLNGVKAISCKDIETKKSKKKKQCTFDKNKVYAGYMKRGALIVDESGNGKSSASWECLKQYPRDNNRGLMDRLKWVNTVDDCIAKKYKTGRIKSGTLENHLGYNKLAYTNKHYRIDVRDKEKLKQFLFTK